MCPFAYFRNPRPNDECEDGKRRILPLGIPASSARTASARTERGVSSAYFRNPRPNDECEDGKRRILPLGIPASSARTASARAERGVSSAGLTMQVHPAANAAATFN